MDTHLVLTSHLVATTAACTIHSKLPEIGGKESKYRNILAFYKKFSDG